MRSIEENVATLRREAELLAAAAASAGAAAAVPTCPGWTVRNLLAHAGGVHAWAASIVRGGLTERPDPGDLDDNARDVSDAALVDWYRARAEDLADAITAAPDDLTCLAFLPAPSPRAFWARRQSHECAIHRSDADAAAGRPTTYDPDQATDGIDEILHGFAARPRSRAAFAPARRVLLRSAEGGAWHLELGPDAVITTDVDAHATVDADATVSGSASDLFLLLWNRIDLDAPTLRIDGDRSVVASWRDNVAVRWG